MKILIINNETKDLESLIALFAGNEVAICTLGEDFDRETYDLYVLSGGSHHSVFFEPSPYEKEIAFIQTSDKSILWICLGCQIIAKAYDSEIDPLPQKLTWNIAISYETQIYEVFEAHRYSIRVLGKELVGLATSPYGYEIIKHQTKPIRWFQFHPEKHMDQNEWKKLMDQVIFGNEK